jgi:hypothetical protein
MMEIERFGSRNEIVLSPTLERLDRCRWQKADATP